MNHNKEYSENQKTDTTNLYIQKVVKGTVIVFIGTIVGQLLAFVGRILFARSFNPSEYGIFSLGITIISIFAVIGTLGLREGTTRQIAYYLSKKQTKKVQSVILWSLMFGVITGIILFLFVFFCADVLAIKIFKMPNLSLPLKIFSISIPFYVALFILNSIFRGFKRVKEKVYFTDIIRNLLFPVLLVPVILLGLSVEWGTSAYMLSISITSVIFIIYFLRKLPITLQLSIKNRDLSVGKELIIFSIPLLLVTILSQVMHWTDTMMLGYFKTQDIVGLYNAATPLGRMISSTNAAMLFIYTPIASGLYAKSKLVEMRKSYTVLTKWLCIATLPITLILALFPAIVINYFFGVEYISASIVLQILVIGLFINSLMGPNGATLTAMAKTNFLMYATFSAACINILLNILLIPKYGINGAAIATVTALVTINILRSIKLYSISKIHSIKKNILKPIFLSVIMFFLVYIIATKFLLVTFWTLPIFFIIYIILYIVSLIITKSFDKEDIDMLLKIESKMGINLKILKRIINKFI